MNFLFDDDQELLRESSRGLLHRVLPSPALRALMDSESGLDPAGWQRGAELGWFSMLVADEHGGGSLTDQGLVDAVVLGEEAGRALLPGPFISTNVVGHALSHYGTDQHHKLLPAIVAGEQIATWCLAEPGAEWDAAVVTTTAERTAEGHRIDGVKLFVESGGIADYFLVVARSNAGLVQLLVPAGSEGISVQAHQSLDLTRRLASITFTDVRVGVDATLAADPGALTRQQQIAAVLTCADSVGGAERVVEDTVRFTKERVQFGRPIASFQAIKHRVADMTVLLDQARVATHYAALAVDTDAADAALAVGIAKAFVADAYIAIAGEGTQLHGGMGFTWEHDLHLFVRRAQANAVMFGTARWYRKQTWPLLAAASAATASRAV